MLKLMIISIFLLLKIPYFLNKLIILFYQLLKLMFLVVLLAFNF